MSHFHFGLQHILWNVSWANMLMFSVSVPRIGEDKSDKVKEIDDFSELDGYFND